MEKVFLYKITNKKNVKVYIGQTNLVDGKVNRYKRCELRKHYRRPISRAISKYGWKNFTHEIVGWCLSRTSAHIAEKALIAYWKTQTKVYNLTDGGEGTSGWHHSQHTRNLMSKSWKPLLSETKTKISNSMRKLWRDKEFRLDRCRRISKGRIGMKFSSQHRKNIAKGASHAMFIAKEKARLRAM